MLEVVNYAAFAELISANRAFVSLLMAFVAAIVAVGPVVALS